MCLTIYLKSEYQRVNKEVRLKAEYKERQMKVPSKCSNRIKDINGAGYQQSPARSEVQIFRCLKGECATNCGNTENLLLPYEQRAEAVTGSLAPFLGLHALEQLTQRKIASFALNGSKLGFRENPERCTGVGMGT
jgi:hypothetical protein